ncbi:hypothetical protein EMIT091MI3_220054 [Kosakonia quasisacchari]
MTNTPVLPLILFSIKTFTNIYLKTNQDNSTFNLLADNLPANNAINIQLSTRRGYFICSRQLML